MIGAATLMVVLGLVAAVGLAFASKVFYVESDPRIDEVLEALPGANCGGCGYPGCSSMAEAIVKGEAPVDGCVAGGPDAAKAVGAAMGVAVTVQEPKLAKPYCGGNRRAGSTFLYDGAMDCQAVADMFGGYSNCTQGCLGLGSCVKACSFDAIRMGEDGYPKFNADACRGCGACVRVCPHNVIQIQTLSSYLTHLNTVDECLAPCRQLCPAQIDIQGYVEAAAKGDYETSLTIIKDRNPLPSVCGRVCPAPCEEGCRRGTIGDDSVYHNTIKRFVADWERTQNGPLELPRLPDTGKSVAIVGGGPAGLTAAYFLRRLGHSPTIFENQDHLGGMLRYGIPEYRLPKRILDWDIQCILDMGVEAKTGVCLGKDIQLSELERDYDAVLVAVGAWVNSTMRVEGEDLPGVWSGIHFLAKREQGEKVDLGDRVAIIGGGNTAIDASRSALREGAKEVSIIYRRTLKEMPANPVEIHAAQEEGINFMFLTAPTKVVPDENGRMKGLEVIEMELGEPDASGRRRPVPKEGSEKFIELDAIIAAIGQRVDASFVEDELKERGLVVTRWNTLDANEDTCQTGIPKIFAAGDGLTGPLLAVTAIGSGRKAARAIHSFLNEEEITLPKNMQTDRMTVSLLADLNGVESNNHRVTLKELDPAERILSYDEVEFTLTQEEIASEAERCLKCGTICYSKDEQREPKKVNFLEWVLGKGEENGPQV